VHALGIAGEVAREEELEASRRLLASLIDTLDEGAGVVSNGTVAFANANISQFFPGASSGRPRAHRDRPRLRRPRDAGRHRSAT